MRNRFAGRPLLSLLCFLIVGVSLPLAGQGSNPAIFPTGLDFGYLPKGTYAVQTVSVYNISGTQKVTVNSITPSIKQLKVVSGTLPITLNPGQRADYEVQFAPDSTGTYAGHLTFAIQGKPNQAVDTTGVGTTTTAIPTLSATTLNFPNQPLGTSSKPQFLTVTNTGTTSLQLTNVVVTYPYAQTGWTTATSIAPGSSLKLTIGYIPTAEEEQPGLISLTYDIAPPNGVSLTGNGTDATALGINMYPTLPAGTPKYLYQANLFAVGGKGPYMWTLATGSTLPAGLSLSSSGLISGTIASSAALQNYTFTAKISDSSTVPQKASKSFTLPVEAYTGYKNCNNISVNAADGSGPLVPLNDLGTNSYLGVAEGGLYADGSNEDDPMHDAYGEYTGSAIVPLDANGNYDPDGKYVFISVGLSVSQQPFEEFVSLVNTDPSKNPSLVVVDAATGGATAALLSSATDNFWNVMIYDYLPNAGVTANQVVAAWVLDVDGGPSGTFPQDMLNLQSQLQSIAQNLLVKFPHLKLAYYSSMNYTGYSDGAANLNPEPYAYESGFAVKNVIQDQISGDPNMNFDPLNGPVVAPWVAWGPYYWANGMIPRGDQLTWSCQDLYVDGTHPSDPAGRIKVSTQLLNFLKTDDTASKWFLAH